MRRGRRWVIAVVLVVTTPAIALATAMSGSDGRDMVLAVGQSLARHDVAVPGLESVDQSGYAIWLVVASDRRAGDVPDGSSPSSTGARADALALVAVPGSGCSQHARVLRLPRELIVRTPEYGRQRLGALLDHGPGPLVEEVRRVSELPIHHYLQIDMVTFVSGVDAAGGVSLALTTPVRDGWSGLNLPSGVSTLDGQAALAYARARNVEARERGQWVMTEPGDLGRIERQERLAESLVARLSDLSPLQLLQILLSFTGRLDIDTNASADDVTRLAASVGHSRWSSEVVATRPLVTEAESVSPFPPAHRGTLPALVLVHARAAGQFAELARLAACPREEAP